MGGHVLISDLFPFSHLTPGCWAEFQDFDVPWYSDDGTYDAESSLGRWYKLFYKATRQHGRELSPGPKLEGWVRGAGFTDVVVKKMRVPVGRWPKDPKLVCTCPFFHTLAWYNRKENGKELNATPLTSRLINRDTENGRDLESPASHRGHGRVFHGPLLACVRMVS